MNVITTILNMLPSIIAAIRAIEDAIPGEGQGEKKLAAVRQILEIADGSMKDLWPKLSGVIGVLVGLMNATGVFRK